MTKKVTSEESVDQQMKSIGEKVRVLRKLKNQNYEVWCYMNDVNKVSLNRLERGENVTVKMLLHILKKLEVTAGNFFNDL
jgi:hypothetical protein